MIYNLKFLRCSVKSLFLKFDLIRRILTSLFVSGMLVSCETIDRANETSLVDEPSSVIDYLRLRNDSSICQSATFGNPLKWNPYAELFLSEAKRRKLACGVVETGMNVPSPSLSRINSKYSYLNARGICHFAASNGNWEARGEYSEYVEEAKRRGLNCGVDERGKIQLASTQLKEGLMGDEDFAVIIANSNYRKLGRGIPNVKPAYTDAKNIKYYFTRTLGFREGNIIYLEDATKAQLTSVFGSEKYHRGKLFNWTKPKVSKIYVYYVGHGAPGDDSKTAYLVPSDTDNETVQLTAYPLKQLFKNLGKIPATSITVILEACFSGQTQVGNLISQTSGITIVPNMPVIPKNMIVISAGTVNQVASWEKDGSQSLFTKYFLKGMSGEGDKKPFGDENGEVSLKELKRYLDGSMTYYARRYYGRTQKAQIVVNGKDL